MIQEFYSNKTEYDSMKKYYDGDHRIIDHYRKYHNKSNETVVDNYINKFVNEEVQYSLGAPLSYVSKDGRKKKPIEAIYNHTFHWKNTHNQDLMRTLGIYGKAYLLHYLDSKGRFCEKILNPANAIAYCNDEGTPILFIRFYTPKYETQEYRDIYYPDGRIHTYKGDSFVRENRHFFNGVPVTVCELDNPKDTIYHKIKSLQDAYNNILSDQVNTISEFRTAYLIVKGVQVDEEGKEALQNDNLLNLPDSGADAKWLVKDVPDAYIQNALNTLRAAMYSNTNHIDGNEKLQSNTSGTALRNRLVFLEQRCNMMLEIVINAVYDRIERLFEYLDKTAQGTFNIKDIVIKGTPSIPKDEIGTVQMLSQLGIGTNISLETALSQLPFIENPVHEIEKIEAEKDKAVNRELDKQTRSKSITLDHIDDRTDDSDLDE